MEERQCVRFVEGEIEKVALPVADCLWEVRPVVAEGAEGDPDCWEPVYSKQPFAGLVITTERANELSGFYLSQERVMEEIESLLHRMRPR